MTFFILSSRGQTLSNKERNGFKVSGSREEERGSMVMEFADCWMNMPGIIWCSGS